eukprot:8861136-Ditylum_brightwellii.AAC.1
MGGHDDVRDEDHVDVSVVFMFQVVVEIISVEGFFGYMGHTVQSGHSGDRHKTKNFHISK